uniref:Leucine-rich repeat protein n=1 Tax=viral metagenome TaxID=1070528 RepID=A0A6C0LRJ2_9ZZZZ
MKYDFNNSDVTDKDIKLLRNCHTLNLSHCKKITDESVKFFGNCHTLDLSGCYFITNESVKM